MHSILAELLIFTTAAVIMVPLFQRLNLGAILGYLFAGVVIGPFALGLIKDPGVILHFSELGLVFLLFIIGLELAPARLWRLRHSIFGLGLLQVLVTGSLFIAVGKLFGLSLSAAYVAGFGLALSSTAFAVQILEDKKQLKTTHGQGSFSILMFQDIAVVPLLASLAIFSEGKATGSGAANFIWVISAVAALIFIGRYVIRYVLRLIADSHTQEVFTAVSLLIVMGTALLFESVGLSMGMGAFLAGVLLANSEYRHELETNLLPFKGLLLGLFFIAVGMTLDLKVLWANPHWVLLLTVALMLTKGLLIYGLGRLFKFPKESARNMAATLPQGGEFGFVLFSAAIAQGLMDSSLASILSASVTISMALTPLVFSLNQKFLRTYSELIERPYDQIDNNQPEVIIAGYGRFGQIVSRFLGTQDVAHTILEHSAAQVDTARKFGSKIYYGDASRLDILEAAGASSAKYLVLAIDNVEKSVETAKKVKENFPNLEIIARVRNRAHALQLIEMGVKIVHRETYLTSLEVAKEIMLLKGRRRESVNRQLAKFREHDEAILRKQLEFRHDEKQMIMFTTKANEELNQVLRADKDT